MIDIGCPTCGSKKIVNVEVKKNDAGFTQCKKECLNCKKFWYTT